MFTITPGFLKVHVYLENSNVKIIFLCPAWKPHEMTIIFIGINIY